VIIRRAVAADVPAMSRVLIASITELCHADHRGDPAAIAAWTANKTPAGITAMLETTDNLLFVAEEGGDVAAVGCVMGTSEVGLNYVDPAHRFKGISRALLAGMEAAMREAGATEGQLRSTTTAHRFYLDAGWVDEGPLYTGRFIDAWPMRKVL
jgi:GNAT superfamily N-acetyltransferase